MEKTIILDDQFWVDALLKEEVGRTAIRLFYNHTIDLANISDGMSLFLVTEEQVCQIILKLLLTHDCSALIEIISQDYKPFGINKADICQYSNFDDAYYRVVDLSIRSGISGITWDRMGFLLRTKLRSKVADTKYGENHGKMAVQMGLCTMDKNHHFWPSQLGAIFNQLSPTEKENLKPKLCLYIPIIQNYFVCGTDDRLMESYFSLLKESTQQRRRPNINNIIRIVKDAIK